MKQITFKACAKINLGLKIVGRRADGYHELRTVYQSISLADTIQVSIGPRRGEVALECEGIAVPPGRDNLVLRAAEALRRELGIHHVISIHLYKRIPTGSGLGGGSSDAAAVLRAIDALTGNRAGFTLLLRLAAQLGSDVPFFLIGGRALGLGRGEEVYPLADSPRRCCLLLVPEKGMSTPEAYRLLNTPPLTASTARPTIESFCAALNAPPAAARERPGNDFEPLLFERFPRLAAAKRALLRAGADWAALTGSGSALFGLFEEYSQARAARKHFERSGMRTFLARTVSRREFGRLIR